MSETIPERISGLDWPALIAELDAFGRAVIPGLLTASECEAAARLHGEDALFRSTVAMERHGYGRGEYRYFGDPLPEMVLDLRQALFTALAPTADRWNEAMGLSTRYPPTHEAYRAECRAAGQTRPTPLLLKYGPGDYNRLHQDVYGERLFPLQGVILLSRPGRDFTGGEFVLTEQQARMQLRPDVVPLDQGDAVIFAVRERPAPGPRGFHRVRLRHGVSRIRTGHRQTLGIIFHDAA